MPRPIGENIEIIAAAKTARAKGERALRLAERQEWQELWELAVDLEQQGITLQRLLSEIDDMP